MGFHRTCKAQRFLTEELQRTKAGKDSGQWKGIQHRNKEFSKVIQSKSIQNSEMKKEQQTPISVQHCRWGTLLKLQGRKYKINTKIPNNILIYIPDCTYLCEDINQDTSSSPTAPAEQSHTLIQAKNSGKRDSFKSSDSSLVSSAGETSTGSGGAFPWPE